MVDITVFVAVIAGKFVFCTLFVNDQPSIHINAIEAVSSIPSIASILEVVCRTTGMGFAAVARVTNEQWIACSVRDEIGFGLLPGGELQLQTTICDEIRQSGEGVIIDCVSEDDHFAAHNTPAMYGFQSYISLPIFLKNGYFFGTLCAIDPKPAHLKNPETIGMFKLFTELISFHLDAMEEQAVAEARLSEELRTAELRDQFMAILGHDLRNPLNAVMNSAQLLLTLQADDDVALLARLIQSSANRMEDLIGNVLDFARGRLGGGIVPECSLHSDMEQILNDVISELAVMWPDRKIDVSYDLQSPVYCDGKRIAQLFSNLLGNALTYGYKDEPVQVKVYSDEERFCLSVTNASAKISETVMDRLFQPFSHGELKSGSKGLGLGLYISSEIAKAHQGVLTVCSTDTDTCFTLEIPRSH